MQSKFLKEIKSFIPVNTWMMIKQNSPMKKVLVFSIEYQTSHNIPLNKNLIHNKAETLFNPLKAEKSWEAREG